MPLILWGTVLILSALKILWGDHEFFMAHFAENFEKREIAEWWGWGYDFIATFFLFFCIPLFLSFQKAWQIPPIGLGIGDHRFGIPATLIAFLLLPIPAYIGSLSAEHQALYPLSPLAMASTGSFILWNGLHLLHYIGWESFYRGFIGMGMRPLLGGIGALSLQVLLTTLMHIDKPNGETIGAIIGGVYLGLLTYRTGSIWYAVLFHAYLGALNSYFCG